MFWQYPFKKRRAESELASITESLTDNSCSLSSHCIDFLPSTPDQTEFNVDRAWKDTETSDGVNTLHQKSKEELAYIAEDLHQKLQVADSERVALQTALYHANNQIENLRQVLAELSHGRAKISMERAELASRYGDLQQEYARALRTANLSRVVSRESSLAVAGARKELANKNGLLKEAHREALSLSQKAVKAESEAEKLRGRLIVLETRVDFGVGLESTCRREIQRHNLAETY